MREDMIKKSKEEAKRQADVLESIAFPREHVEKALELSYREGYLDGQEFMLRKIEEARMVRK